MILHPNVKDLITKGAADLYRIQSPHNLITKSRAGLDHSSALACSWASAVDSLPNGFSKWLPKNKQGMKECYPLDKTAVRKS